MVAARGWRRTLGVVSLAAAAVGGGCAEDAPKVTKAYTPLPPREVPAYMHESVYEIADLSGTEPLPVSGYGLVANLHGTGGCQAPTAVRDYMVKELARQHQANGSGGYLSPDKILDDNHFAIVKVEGLIPPGARAGHDARGNEVRSWFDLRVTAVPAEVTSLAHGTLLSCDLKLGGANPIDPGNGQPESLAEVASTAVFVNPTYVLRTEAVDSSPTAKASRRSALVLAGAEVTSDRPLRLRLRTPERRLARAIERRVNEQFQAAADEDLQSHGNTAAKKVANAQDEGVIDVYVPLAYVSHWEHFAGLLTHLYLPAGDSSGYAALKARELADAAVEPHAKLDDISYAWEGLGKPALFALDPLMLDPMPVTHKLKRPDGTTVDGPTLMEHHPDVRFAAARAAAFIGDPAAVPVLLDIAATPGNDWRVNAVDALAELPPSPRTDGLCRSLLDSDEQTVRTAAYQLLARHHDPSILTHIVRDDDREIFLLDVVRTAGRAGSGRPMVFATQRGIPRIAVFGTDTAVDLPIMFPTLDGRLIISGTDDASEGMGRLSVTYRSPYRRDLAEFTCRPTLPGLIAMMGGDGTGGPSATRLHLNYGDVVAVVQALIDEQRVSGTVGGERLAATFVLGEPAASPLPPPPGRGDRDLVRPDARPEGRPTGTDQRPADDGLLRAQPRADATPVGR